MSGRTLATAQKQSAPPMAPGRILQRKCACGNHATAGVCEECSKRRSPRQRKFTLGSSNDPLEQAADRAAAHVVSGRPVYLAGLGISGIQRFAKGAEVDVAPASVERELANPGVPLQSDVRKEMEGRFGYDFSHVRVHTGGLAEQSARQIDANAYTVDHHIVFGAHQFAPTTSEGRRLISHELAHVVQQSGAEAANAGRADQPRSLSSSNSGFVQRQRRGAAGGCGICLPPPAAPAAGVIAHAEIQAAFVLQNPNILAEDEVPVGPPDEHIPFKPRADLSYVTHEGGESIIHIGEIKPLDDAGVQAGIARQELQDYARELRFTYDHVFNMHDEPPNGPIPFVSPFHPPTCPTQNIRVRRTEPGIYQYFCQPPFSELVRDPRCTCKSKDQSDEERQRDRVPIPVTPPLGVPVPQGQGRPEGVPETGPTPTGKPDPVKPQATPGEEGDNVIPLRRPGRPTPGQPGKESKPPSQQPEEVPLAAKEKVDARPLIWILAALALTLIGRKILPALLKSGAKGGPILALAQAVAAAAVIILSQRQAKAGESKTDDDPMVALAQMLDDTGQKMPPEIRKLLEENPELRELIRIEMERRRRAGTLLGSTGVQGGSGSKPDGIKPEGKASAGPDGAQSVAGGEKGGQSASKGEENKGLKVGISVADPAHAPTSQEEKWVETADKQLAKFEWIEKNAQHVPLPLSADKYVVGQTYDLAMAGRDAQGVLYVGVIAIKIVFKKGNHWTVTIGAGRKLYTYGRLYGTTSQTTNTFTYTPPSAPKPDAEKKK